MARLESWVSRNAGALSTLFAVHMLADERDGYYIPSSAQEALLAEFLGEAGAFDLDRVTDQLRRQSSTARAEENAGRAGVRPPGQGGELDFIPVGGTGNLRDAPAQGSEIATQPAGQALNAASISLPIQGAIRVPGVHLSAFTQDEQQA